MPDAKDPKLFAESYGKDPHSPEPDLVQDPPSLELEDPRNLPPERKRWPITPEQAGIEPMRANLRPTVICDPKDPPTEANGIATRQIKRTPQGKVIQILPGEPLVGDMLTPDSCLEVIQRASYSIACGEITPAVGGKIISAAQAAAKIHEMLDTPSLAESVLLQFAQAFPHGPDDPAWLSREQELRHDWRNHEPGPEDDGF